MHFLYRYSMPLILLSLFGCFQKKKQPGGLEGWLESNFPGQLSIVRHVIDLDPKNLYYRKTATIVADQQDHLVQMRITWYKNQEDLGITQEEVQQSLLNARKDIQKAHTLLRALKAEGMDKLAVGVVDMAAYILIYKEPVPVLRKEELRKILSAYRRHTELTQTSIWIECMEPEIYRKDFDEIIPFGYWHRGDQHHQDHKIMSLDFEWSQALEPEVLDTHWKINPASARSTRYAEEAYRAAEAWAAKNLPTPYYLEGENMIEFEADPDDPLAIRYYFPYFSEKPDTAASGFEEKRLGYVSCTYQTDIQSFSQIKKVKDL